MLNLFRKAVPSNSGRLWIFYCIFEAAVLQNKTCLDRAYTIQVFNLCHELSSSRESICIYILSLLQSISIATCLFPWRKKMNNFELSLKFLKYGFWFLWNNSGQEEHKKRQKIQLFSWASFTPS